MNKCVANGEKMFVAMAQQLTNYEWDKMNEEWDRREEEIKEANDREDYIEELDEYGN